VVEPRDRPRPRVSKPPQHAQGPDHRSPYDAPAVTTTSEARLHGSATGSVGYLIRLKIENIGR